MIHATKAFGLVNKTEIDVFLEFPCFSMIQQMLTIWSLVPLPFLNPVWTSESSQFMYLKPGLENFEHYFAIVWDECNCEVVWTFLALPFFGIRMKTDLFQSCGHCWVFQICWYIECSTFTASSFQIWNSSAGIPSHPLALFIVMIPKAHLTSHSRCLALDEWSHHHGYLSHEDLFCIILLCILATSFYPYIRENLLYTFKGQGLENGLFCIFQTVGNIFYKRCWTSMTQHSQQSTGLELKE